MPAPKGNKYAKWNSWKPKKFKTPEDLQMKIDQYFEECDSRVVQVYSKSMQEIVDMKKPRPYTIEWLCEILECDRDTVLNYEKWEWYEDYFGIIKKAKMKIQRNKVERGLDWDSNPAVTIFDLKNNHSYKEKQEVDVNVWWQIDESNLYDEKE